MINDMLKKGDSLVSAAKDKASGAVSGLSEKAGGIAESVDRVYKLAKKEFSEVAHVVYFDISQFVNNATKDIPVSVDKILDNPLVQKLLLGDIPGLMIYCPKLVQSDAPAYLFVPSSDLIDFGKKLVEAEVELKKYGLMVQAARKISEPVARAAAMAAFEKNFGDTFIDLKTKAGKAIPKMQEIILLNKSAALEKFESCFAYVNIDGIAEKWIKKTASELEQTIKKEIKDEIKPLVEYVNENVKKYLWLSETVTNGQVFSQWKFALDSAKATAETMLSADYDAVFMRLMGAAVDSLKLDKKEIKVEFDGSGLAVSTVSHAQTTFDVHYPSKSGYDLFKIAQLFGLTDVKHGSSCFVRFSLSGKAYGFLSAQCAVALPSLALNLQNGKPTFKMITNDQKIEKLQISADVKSKTFGDSAGKVEIICDGEWKDPVSGEWRSFIPEGGKIVEAVKKNGISVDPYIDFEYKNGKIVFTVSADLIIGLNGEFSFTYEMPIEEGFAFLKHIIESTGFKKLGFIVDECYMAYYMYQYYDLLGMINNIDQMKKGALESISTWWNSKVDPSVQTLIYAIDQVKLLTTAPETLARLVRILIQQQKTENYKTILKILEQTKETVKQGDPNKILQWVIRYASNDLPDKIKSQKDVYLQKGKDILLDYFEHPLSKATQAEVERLESLLDEVK